MPQRKTLMLTDPPVKKKKCNSFDAAEDYVIQPFHALESEDSMEEVQNQKVEGCLLLFQFIIDIANNMFRKKKRPSQLKIVITES